jgi:hypothetical protein
VDVIEGENEPEREKKIQNLFLCHLKRVKGI